MTHFKSGEWNVVCDICKFKFKSSKLKLNWRGQMVCEDDWEPRNIQDFIKVRAESGSPPWSRPRGEDVFINYCNIVNSQGIAGIGLSGCMVAGKIATGNLT